MSKEWVEIVRACSVVGTDYGDDSRGSLEMEEIRSKLGRIKGIMRSNGGMDEWTTLEKKIDMDRRAWTKSAQDVFSFKNWTSLERMM